MAAIYNGYVDANLVAGKITSAAASGRAQELTGIVNFAIGSGDTAGSIYRLFKAVSPDLIINKLELFSDAITGGSAAIVGFYGVQDWDNVGAIVGTGNQLMASTDISAGTAVTAAPRSLLTAVSVANRGKRVYELAGHTQATKLPAYDICLTMSSMTTGGGAANVSVMLAGIQG